MDKPISEEEAEATMFALPRHFDWREKSSHFGPEVPEWTCDFEWDAHPNVISFFLEAHQRRGRKRYHVHCHYDTDGKGTDALLKAPLGLVREESTLR